MQALNDADARRAKAEADLPPLPPLLAQILAETRAKQQAAKEGREYVPERKPAGDGNASDDEAAQPSGPLLLEGPSAGLVVQGTNVPERQPGDSDSDSDAEPEAPLGPLDPARCRVHGPGFSGGAAGQPVKLTLTARDANGKRIREGGAMVLVMVEPPRAPGAEEEPDAIEAEVTDHGDGTYTAVYTVPTKGNYQLHIEVDGDPVGDSPYPVFFSAAKPVADGGAAAAGAAAAPGQAAQAAQPASGAQLPAPVTTSAGIQVVTAQSIKAAQAQTQTQLGAAAAAGDMGASVALAAGFPGGAAAQPSLGGDMVRSGMAFPAIEAEQLQRMVVVGGVSPLATPDALKSVFSLAGAIVSCQLAPIGTGFAFVTFSSAAEAANALTMGGASMMGQPLKVELATEAKKAADAALAAHNPYAALQAQQLAHFQMLQQQQAALAQQVVTMRVAQRTGVQLPLDQRIVLKKEANGSERRRSRSRSRSRERGSRRRSRSRDRERDRRSGRRSRSRERGGRRRSRSRSRSRDRDRKRSHRSRSRERGSRHKEHKHKHHHKHHKRSHRSRSREREERKGEKSAGGEKMEVDAAAQPPAAAADGNKDDLEALLDEFDA